MKNEILLDEQKQKIAVEEFNRAITLDENENPISYVYDDEWDFKYSRHFATNKECREINFTKIPHEYKREVQAALAMILEKSPKISLATLLYERGNLVRLAKLVGSADWNAFNNDLNFRLFKVNLKRKKYSRSTVKGTLITLNQLFTLRLTTRQIENVKSTSSKLASKNKRKKRQHIAIPEDIATQIFKAAEEVVNKYHPYRKDISDAYLQYYNELNIFLANNPAANNKEFWEREGHKISSNVDIKGFEAKPKSEELNLIKTACMILILGYSGVRHGEGLSIGKKSYKEKEYHGFSVPYIEGISTKSNEGGVPKAETWITHPIVKIALELLFDVTEFSREIYSKKYENNDTKLEAIQNGLLSTDILYHKSNVLWSTTSLTKWFNKFLRDYEIVATEKDVQEFDKLNPTRKGELGLGGYLPKLSSHDFRRTFAVFLIRNKLGSIMSLKYQYKHLNEIMSQWYANNSELVRALDLKADAELQELVHESNILIMTEAAFEIFNSPTLSGGEGEKIDQERQKEQYSGNIYASRKELERQVRAGSLSVVEHPTGYCFNPECSRISSSEISNVTCKHIAVTRKNALEKLPKRIRLISRFNNLLVLGDTFNSIKNRLFVEIKSIEFTLKHHSISFEPFEKQNNCI